jgi:hypothetical protein
MEGEREMADVKKVSEQLIDYAGRLENVVDAAQGKESGRAPRARWLLLPAAGAGLYALTTSGAFTRQARDVAKEARDRAAELPDALLSRVQQAASNGTGGGRQSSRSRASSRSGTRSRRKPTAGSKS